MYDLNLSVKQQDNVKFFILHQHLSSQSLPNSTMDPFFHKNSMSSLCFKTSKRFMGNYRIVTNPTKQKPSYNIA